MFSIANIFRQFSINRRKSKGKQKKKEQDKKEEKRREKEGKGGKGREKEGKGEKMQFICFVSILFTRKMKKKKGLITQQCDSVKLSAK